MHNYWEPGWRKIKAATNGRNVSEFAKQVGVTANTVRGWIRSDKIEECAFPGVEKLGEIAKALGVQPWELLRPEGAIPTPTPTEEDLLAMVKARDKRIRELEALNQIPADLAAALATASPKKLEGVRALLGVKAKAEEKSG